MKMKKAPVLLLIIIFISGMALPAGATIWDPWHSKDEKIEMWMSLWSTRANADYLSVGKTYNGNDMWMFRAGNPNGGCILLDGEIHGNEDKGSELLYLLAEWLLTSGEPEAEKLLSDNYILFIPVVDVDRAARGNANYEDSIDGVDLNRNFVTGWQKTNIDNDIYSGPYPASEPETQALRKVFETIRPDFYINTHCGAGPTAFYSLEGDQKIVSKIMELIQKKSQAMGITPYTMRGLTSKGFSIGDASSYGASSWLIEVDGSSTAWRHTDELYQDLEKIYLPKLQAILISMGEYSAVSGPVIPPPPSGGGSTGGGGGTPPKPDMNKRIVEILDSIFDNSNIREREDINNMPIIRYRVSNTKWMNIHKNMRK